MPERQGKENRVRADLTARWKKVKAERPTLSTSMQAKSNEKTTI